MTQIVEQEALSSNCSAITHTTSGDQKSRRKHHKWLEETEYLPKSNGHSRSWFLCRDNEPGRRWNGEFEELRKNNSEYWISIGSIPPGSKWMSPGSFGDLICMGGGATDGGYRNLGGDVYPFTTLTQSCLGSCRGQAEGTQLLNTGGQAVKVGSFRVTWNSEYQFHPGPPPPIPSSRFPIFLNQGWTYSGKLGKTVNP
jgi:hypothetical protein